MDGSPKWIAASLLAVALASTWSSDARACGGCFLPQTETQTTVVTGHRMAFAISPTHTVLWDQIKYAGSPKEFAWVLPVRGGAVLEISHDAWFETLDAATSAQIVSPPVNCISAQGPGCSGGGCFGGTSASAKAFGIDHSGAAAPPSVTVTHEGTVGPYETVTLHANVKDALPNWLTSHGYNIDPKVSPIIDQYTNEGFDFIALRLLPGVGVNQMKPVRVVTPGMSNALPLRMVAAGTGANVAITLFVIGEGRWEAQNFPNGSVDPSTLTWDFDAQSSDYSAKRLALMAQSNGRTWNNAFANQGSLLSQDNVNGASTSITVGGQFFATFAQAYVAQGVADGEVTGIDTSGCLDTFQTYANSKDQVVGCSNPPAPDAGAGASGTGGAGTGGAGTGGLGTGGTSLGFGGGAPCADIPLGDDAASYACGPLDDIAVALVGLHPADVWLTRLEANLPHDSLAADLQLRASANQTAVSNVLSATNATGNPCPGIVGGTIATAEAARRIAAKNQIAALGAIMMAVAAALARRRRSTLLPAT
jgi:hypothetical protein